MDDTIKSFGYSASFGYSMNNENYSVDELIKLADIEMYNSKKQFYNKQLNY